MARLALTICLSFLLVCTISCISWGDIDENMESNNIYVPMEQIVDDNTHLIKSIPSNQFFIPNSVFLQPRIAVSASGTTIRYVLGKRVTGE